MAELGSWQSSLQSTLRASSMGLKLIVVCVLAFLMIIPALLVLALLQDRKSREADVIKEISQYAGGPQTFLGPVLAIPYTVPAESSAQPPRRGTYLVSPAEGSSTVKTTTEERHRSLFKVPVFQADLKLDSKFDLTDVGNAAPPGAELDWKRAEVLVGVSDARGALADATLTIDGRTFTLVPAEETLNLSTHAEGDPQLRLTFLAAHVPDIVAPGAQFAASSALRFSGAQRLAILSYAKTTHVVEDGDWPNPGFDGGFLPVKRTITPTGFSAEWSVPFIARGVRAEGPADSTTGLDGTALGVSFVEVADPYQSVSRSLKYAPLFLGLVFLLYFVLEATTGKRVHPAQYILVGFAQVIFYLLLLSFAERIGFDFGFLVAGVSCVSLLAANAGWIFDSRLQALRALAAFGSLYLLIYLLLRLEDNALLLGAIASFAAIGTAMYLTRKIDWYHSLPPTSVASAGASDAR